MLSGSGLPSPASQLARSRRGDRVLHRQFASTSRTSWGGLPALASPNDVLILFTKVDTAPAIEPQTAIWHFGWHVTDARETLDTYRRGRTSRCCRSTPSDEGGTVFISSDTWPGTGGVLGLDARRRSPRPRPRASSRPAAAASPTCEGPDNAIVEYAGQPAGRALQPRAHVPGAIRSARSSGTSSTSTRRSSPGAPAARR